MRTLKLTVAYDGTSFVGWQRQSNGVSIQELLQRALEGLEGAPVVVHGAGRTDAGVHAVAQVASTVVSFRHDAATVQLALNARLPADVRVTAVEDAASGFHARFHARAKTYRYQIALGAVISPFVQRVSWHVRTPLDVQAMDEAARLLTGSHDFAVFQSSKSVVSTTVRTVTLSRVRVGHVALPDSEEHQLVVYDVRGNGFLRHMVRAIVGTLVDVGCGRRSAGSISTLLGGQPRAAAGPNAPARGLFLVGVEY
jgi:tRNA pseudouridine38-40 synthase